MPSQPGEAAPQGFRSVDDVAEAAGRSTETVRVALRTGQLNGAKMGEQRNSPWVVEDSEHTEAWIASRLFSGRRKAARGDNVFEMPRPVRVIGAEDGVGDGGGPGAAAALRRAEELASELADVQARLAESERVVAALRRMVELEQSRAEQYRRMALGDAT